MAQRLCKYECGTDIQWNNAESAFYEVETGQRHTQERCKELKSKVKVQAPSPLDEGVTKLDMVNMIGKLAIIEKQNDEMIRALKDFGEILAKMSFHTASQEQQVTGTVKDNGQTTDG